MLLRKLFFIFMFFLTVFSMYSFGKKEVSEAINVGAINVVVEKAGYNLTLRYFKPDGYDKILNEGYVAILIYNLIADGKKIIGKKHSSPYGGGAIYGDEAVLEGSYYNIQMFWSAFSPLRTIEGLKKGVYFRGFNRDFKYTHYGIPYGTKEVFMTFSIRIPAYKNLEDFSINRNYYFTEPETVRWLMSWPEVSTD